MGPWSTVARRSSAWAALGNAEKVRFVPLAASGRFPALQAGTIDVLVRQTTWTLGREISLKARFPGIHAFGILNEADIISAMKTAGGPLLLLFGGMVVAGTLATTAFSSVSGMCTSVPRGRRGRLCGPGQARHVRQIPALRASDHVVPARDVCVVCLCLSEFKRSLSLPGGFVAPTPRARHKRIASTTGPGRASMPPMTSRAQGGMGPRSNCLWKWLG